MLPIIERFSGYTNPHHEMTLFTTTTPATPFPSTNPTLDQADSRPTHRKRLYLLPLPGGRGPG